MSNRSGGPESRDIDPDHVPVRDFIQLDIVSAAVASLVIVVVNLFFVQVAGLWLVVASLVVLIGVLVLAGRQIARREVGPALALVAGGNWVVSLVVLALLPWLLPVMVLTIVMPLVLAAPYLVGKQLTGALTAAALTLAGAGFLAISNDDGGVIDDVDDVFELLVIVGGMAGHAAPIGLVVWQASQRHHRAVEDANELNALLSDSLRRLVEAGDAERTRIERNLHDGAQQRLISIGMDLRLRQGDGVDLAPVITELEGAMADIRELSHGISPPLLEVQGLVGGLGAAIRRAGTQVRFDHSGVGRYSRSVETSVYFCALEAMQNASKHAPGAMVQVRLTDDGSGLSLQVADDGPGFDLDATRTSTGTVSMADRIGSIGGHLLIESERGTGTTVYANVPDPDRQENP